MTKQKRKKDLPQHEFVALARKHQADGKEYSIAKRLLAEGFLARSLSPRRKPSKEAGDFYTSREWASVRYAALLMADGCCACCGASRNDGAVMHVDHIKPRSKFPELALSIDNLQVLCNLCNVAKSNIDMTRWHVNMNDGTSYTVLEEDELKVRRMLRSMARDG